MPDRLLESGFTDTVIKMEGVILSEAKNPEGDGGNDQAHIVWIFHSAARSLP